MVSAFASRRFFGDSVGFLNFSRGARSWRLGSCRFIGRLHHVSSSGATPRPSQSRSSRGSKRRTSCVRRPARASRPGRAGRPRGRAPAPARCRARPPRPARPAPAAPSASAVSWQSRAFCDAAADDVHDVDVAAGQRGGLPDVAAVGQRQAVEDAAGDRDRRPRDRLAAPRGASCLRSGPACRPAASSRGSSMSTTVRSAAPRSTPASSAGRSRRRSPVAPGAQRLREHPEAHHVLQEPDRAVDAALVGEVGEPRVLGQHRLVELEADQRPGARGDVGGAARRRRARRPPRRRCRASRPRSPGRRRAGRRARATSGSSGPTTVAGVAQRRQDRPRAGRAARRGRAAHSRDAHVVQPGRRGVGALGTDRRR